MIESAPESLSRWRRRRTTTSGVPESVPEMEVTEPPSFPSALKQSPQSSRAAIVANGVVGFCPSLLFFPNCRSFSGAVEPANRGTVALRELGPETPAPKPECEVASEVSGNQSFEAARGVSRLPARLLAKPRFPPQERFPAPVLDS